MKPYYQAAGITVYHGDAREIMPGLPPGLVVTDPPYNVGYAYDLYTDRLTPGDYRGLLAAALRLPCVVLHYAEGLFEVASVLGEPPQKVVAWVYHSMNHRQWRALGWFGIKPDFGREGQDYRNPTDRRIRERIANGEEARLYDWWLVEQVKNVSEEKTGRYHWKPDNGHPCQIPLPVMRRAINITPHDGPVIDPFCGSGTTLRAAKDLGREAIGIDSSEAYCEIAARRLSQEVLALVA